MPIGEVTGVPIGEGLPIGVVRRSRGRTIGEGEFAILSDLTWTTRERQANGEAMARRGESGRELAAPVVVALVASLAALGSPQSGAARGARVETLAAMGLEAEFPAPSIREDTLGPRAS